jgi:hypothetical protein
VHFVFLGLFSVLVMADTIVQNTAGASSNIVSIEVGQSLTTGAGGPWNNITFAFLGPAGNVAGGDLFILSSAYSGTPSGLSSATSGFLAQSTGVGGGAWTFAPTFTLAQRITRF